MVHTVACQCTLLWFLTWWLTHDYCHTLMTKSITSHNPFIGLLEENSLKNFHDQFCSGIFWRKPQNKIHQAVHRQRKCPWYQSQFIIWHSLLVTYRDRNECGLLQAGLSVHFRQEVVKVTSRVLNEQSLSLYLQPVNNAQLNPMARLLLIPRCKWV